MFRKGKPKTNDTSLIVVRCGIAEKLLRDYANSLSTVLKSEKWTEYAEHVKTCAVCQGH